MWSPPAAARQQAAERQQRPGQQQTAEHQQYPGQRQQQHLLISEFNGAAGSNVHHDGIRTASTTDHTGHTVPLAWYVRPGDVDHSEYADDIYPFPHHVYVLDSAHNSLQDQHLPHIFVNWLHKTSEAVGNGPISQNGMRSHFEFHTGMKNILDCITHLRKEIEWRNRNAIRPRLVPYWNIVPPYHGVVDYSGRITVIDRDDWPQTGLIFVKFHPTGSDQTHEYWLSQGRVPFAGSELTLIAEKVVDVAHHAGIFRSAWHHAGGELVQADLARRNNGMVSPVLYPAVDPAAHHDVDHDDHNELQASFDVANIMEETEHVDNVTDRRWPAQRFSPNELWKSAADLPDIATGSYSDTIGWPITSVWKRSLSRERPAFSFTMYVACDVPPLASEALFGCLDRGLLKDVSWTLDIVRGIPDKQSALRHVAHGAIQRNPTRIKDRKNLYEMLFRKIIGSRFPEELVQQIVSFAVPPSMPDYSCSGVPAPRLFMYLITDNLRSGPEIIYDNQASNVQAKRDLALGHKDFVLLANHYRYWPVVADELHIIWSYCGPRCDLPAGLIMPTVSLCLSFQSSLHVSAIIRLQSDQPITLHENSIRRSIARVLQLRNVENNTICSPTAWSCYSTVKNIRGASWSNEPTIGYQNWGTGWQTLSPSRPCGEVCYLYYDFARQIEDGGMEFRPRNHVYEVNVTSNESQLEHWTFGSPPDLAGPYNLPPIPVTIEGDKTLQFKRDFTVLR